MVNCNREQLGKRSALSGSLSPGSKALRHQKPVRLYSKKIIYINMMKFRDLLRERYPDAPEIGSAVGCCLDRLESFHEDILHLKNLITEPHIDKAVP